MLLRSASRAAALTALPTLPATCPAHVVEKPVEAEESEDLAESEDSEESEDDPDDMEVTWFGLDKIPGPTNWECFNNGGYRRVDRCGCARDLTEEEDEYHERAYNKVRAKFLNHGWRQYLFLAVR